jgi:hypothetical protein
VETTKEKICIDCKIILPIFNFGTYGKSKVYYTRCKICYRKHYHPLPNSKKCKNCGKIKPRNAFRENSAKGEHCLKCQENLKKERKCKGACGLIKSSDEFLKGHGVCKICHYEKVRIKNSSPARYSTLRKINILANKKRFDDLPDGYINTQLNVMRKKKGLPFIYHTPEEILAYREVILLDRELKKNKWCNFYRIHDRKPTSITIQAGPWLLDHHVKKLVVEQFKILKEDVTNELISYKRTALQLKRECKKLINVNEVCCKVCNDTEISHFSINKAYPTGLEPKCKVCFNIDKRERRSKRPAEKRQAELEKQRIRRSLRTPEQKLVDNKKQEEYRVKRRANQTDEEIRAISEKQRLKRLSLSPEEKCSLLLKEKLNRQKKETNKNETDRPSN